MITSNTTRNYEWDHSDQLRAYYNQTGTSEPTVYAHYLYDAGGNRVKKLLRTQGGDYEVIVYIDGIFEYHKKISGANTYEKNELHIMDDTSRIAMKRIGIAYPDDISDAEVYILEDHLGSSSVRLNANGTVIDREEYYPFGDSSLRTFSKKRYRFTGKEKDSESGLYYYGARYYAAWTGRFISVDPLASEYVHLSPYNYASNNPIKSIDVDGMQNGDEQKSPQGGEGSQNTDDKNSEKGTMKIYHFRIHPNGAVEELKEPDTIPATSETSGKAMGIFYRKDLENGEWMAGYKYSVMGSTDVVEESKLPTFYEKFKDTDEQKDNSNLSEEEIINYINNGILLLSISKEAIQNLGGLDEARKLIEQGKFQMNYNGELKTWKLSFQGNKAVSAEIVSAGKADFAAIAAKNSKVLNVLKTGGVILSLAGFGISYYQYKQGQISGYELAADGLFTAVGFLGAPGAVVSITYFGIKAIYKNVPENFEELYPYPSKYYRYGE